MTFNLLVTLLSDLRELQYINLGSLLKEIKVGELYKTEIGAGIDTFYQFLCQPEIGMTVNEANFLIKAYDKAKEGHYNFRDISPRKLKYLLSSANIDELIDDARTLSNADFIERHYDKKTNNEARTYEYLVMRRCNETGSLSKVGGVESNEVKEVFKDKIYE
jgi:hypothetical protein